MSTSVKQAGDTSLSCKDTIILKRFIFCPPHCEPLVSRLHKSKIWYQTEVVQTESRVIQEYENPVSAAKY